MPAVHEWVITGAYGLISFKMLAEVIRLRWPLQKPKQVGGPPTLLLVGTNEEPWLRGNLPLLRAEGFRIYYFDLGSTDASVEAAASQGVIVLKGLPPDKADPQCYASYRLVLAASEDSPDDWWAFLPVTGTAEAGLGIELACWAQVSGRKHSHLVGLARTDSPSQLNEVWSFWKEMRGILSFEQGGNGFLPQAPGVGSPIHLWRSSSLLHRTSQDPHPPYYSLKQMGHSQTPRQLKILSAWLRTPGADTPGSLFSAFFVAAWSLAWILAGSLWPVALAFLFTSYLSVALTSKNILKALTVLPFSVAVAPAIMLRNHFIRISKRSKR